MTIISAMVMVLVEGLVFLVLLMLRGVDHYSVGLSLVYAAISQTL